MLKDFGFQQKILESGWRKTHKIGSRTKTTQRPDKDNSNYKDQRPENQRPNKQVFLLNPKRNFVLTKVKWSL
jgi:hypothetical protein